MPGEWSVTLPSDTGFTGKKIRTLELPIQQEDGTTATVESQLITLVEADGSYSNLGVNLNALKDLMNSILVELKVITNILQEGMSIKTDVDKLRDEIVSLQQSVQ